jgi:hypothetical protein
MKNNKIIYSLNITDVQIVALEELNRKLTKEEIELVIDKIGEKINWHDVISDSINEIVILKWENKI